VPNPGEEGRRAAWPSRGSAIAGPARVATPARGRPVVSFYRVTSPSACAEGRRRAHPHDLSGHTRPLRSRKARAALA
jgi:hypothetical protein